MSRSLQAAIPSKVAGFDFDVVTDMPVKRAPIPKPDQPNETGRSKPEPAKTAEA